MKLKIKFSKKTTFICLVLIIAMLRASYWQWERHLEKVEYLKVLEQRLVAVPLNFAELVRSNPKWEDYINFRVLLEGSYDFSNEIVIANRRLDDTPGKNVITPLKLKDQVGAVLINRGFIPLSVSKVQDRIAFQKPEEQRIIGIIKPSLERTFFLQPQDPEVSVAKKDDNWLRVNISAIGKQIEYPILPIYIDKISVERDLDIEKDLIKSESDKTDMLVMPSNKVKISTGSMKAEVSYPIPDPGKVMSAGRHLGYVFEWAFMALLTFLIGLVIQLKRH